MKLPAHIDGAVWATIATALIAGLTQAGPALAAHQGTPWWLPVLIGAIVVALGTSAKMSAWHNADYPNQPATDASNTPITTPIPTPPKA